MISYKPLHFQDNAIDLRWIFFHVARMVCHATENDILRTGKSLFAP